MGNPKQRWTPEEEEALRRGILKYGTGRWKNIICDHEFRPYLRNRSNIDLKDKWRNLTVVARDGDKSRAQRLKELTDVPVVKPSTVSRAPRPPPLALSPPASSTLVSKDVKKVPDAEDPLNGKVVSKYHDTIIYEALSNLNEPNGSDTTSIINYFEKKGEMPNPKFRKKITERLRRLAGLGKLLKLPNHCYKLKTEDTPEGTKIPIPKPNNSQLKAQPPQPEAKASPQPITQSSPQPKAQPPTQPKAQSPTQPQVKVLQVPIRGYLGDSIEEATLSAAFTVSDAENKSFALATAVRESERVAKMSEETERMLHLALEILSRSVHGETVVLV